MRGHFTTHCFRQGGTQWQFLYAPLHLHWKLDRVCWWGNWAKGKHVSHFLSGEFHVRLTFHKRNTMVRYLLNELDTVENDHSDAMNPAYEDFEDHGLQIHPDDHPMRLSDGWLLIAEFQEEIKDLITTHLSPVNQQHCRCHCLHYLPSYSPQNLIVKTCVQIPPAVLMVGITQSHTMVIPSHPPHNKSPDWLGNYIFPASPSAALPVLTLPAPPPLSDLAPYSAPVMTFTVPNSDDWFQWVKDFEEIIPERGLHKAMKDWTMEETVRGGHASKRTKWRRVWMAVRDSFGVLSLGFGGVR
jgi:hypothetical protein